MKSHSVREVRVQGGGGGLVGHVGLHALGAFADRLGPAASLSCGVRWAGERAPVHDRGKVLTQAMLMLAGGGEAWADIEYLRAEEGLFGDVASAPTLYRTVRALDPATVEDLWAAQAAAREEVWARRAPDDASVAVVLDIDDHIDLLDAAIARLPAAVYVGHRAGDDADLATRPVVLRADSAGCSTKIAEACRDRNVGYSLVARRNAAIDSAIAAVAVTDKYWQPAIKQNGDVRPGAVVADLTDYVVWFQQLACATTAFAGAAAKRLRRALWHTPGRLVRSGRRTIIRLPDNHPTTPHLTRIYDHIAAFHRHRRRRPQKHHNRHHKPPGGPTTRAPTPTTNAPNNTPPHPKPTIKHPTNTPHPAQRPQQEPNHPQNHSHEQSGLVPHPAWLATYIDPDSLPGIRRNR